MGVQRTAWLSVEWTEDVAPEEALILSLGEMVNSGGLCGEWD